MLLGASICPHPPVLVPGVCRQEPQWLVALRGACLVSIRHVIGLGADRVVVIGVDDRAGRWDAGAQGSVSRYGVERAERRSGELLPLSLTVGAALLDAAGWAGQRDYVAVARATSAEACAELGRALVSVTADDPPDHVALLVMGDGSAKRTHHAPGPYDERAADYDARTVAALAAADASGLMSMNATLADELWVAGREAWQVLAGAVPTPAAAPDPPTAFSSTIRFDDVPLGVGYVVADWSVRRADHATD